MRNYVTLFAGVASSWQNIQGYFNEFEDLDDDEDDDEDLLDDDDDPTCLAGQKLGFGWYDHDNMDYVYTEEPLGLDAFFDHERIARIEKDWAVNLDFIKGICQNHKMDKIGYIFHLGEEMFNPLQAGKSADFNDGGNVIFLGYFCTDGGYYPGPESPLPWIHTQ